MNFYFPFIFYYGVLLFLLLNFIEHIVGFNLPNLQSLISLVIFCYALITLRIRAKLFPILLIVLAGLISLFTNQANIWEVYWMGMLELADIIVLILIVPLISWIILHEKYIDSIFSKASFILKTRVSYFSGVMLFTQVLSHFLLIGSIPLIYQFVKENIKETHIGIEKLKNLSILRGFSLGTLWVVTIPSFSYSVQTSNASILTVIIQGFIFSSISILVSIYFFVHKYQSAWVNAASMIDNKISSIEHQIDKGYMNKCVKEFLLLFIFFFGVTVLIHLLLDWDLLVVIPQVTIICVLAYFLFKKSLILLMSHSKHYFLNDIMRKNEELSIYFSVSIFIYAVQVSDIGIYIADVLNLLTSSPLINLYMLLPFLMVLLGFVGLGPLTSMVLVGGLINSLSIDFIPELLVLSLTVGSAISIMMSPIGVSVIMLSTVSNIGKLELSLKSNYTYCLFIYLFSQVYIQVILTISN
ncbi:hypothetical protein CIL05_17315 [Virgibacillus profundi]|uniref:Permease n=1 Tax=Virgibacillus profundi TaxID=2024555 RepID=A0A2A2I9Z1_9BACI|nr:hypothetical protein [Virgibacillus profundi]PAV28392.1 hypothetical protein CIL05_17315 [Virgibacillus profundi]PXY52246.1 hypothetical protein CIT14_18460 [Virgibacillus profundi]